MASKFTKAKAEQAKFKAGLYGSQGSGKTFTSLLLAEGLAARDGKRVAFIDTERGSDFYAMTIPERKLHPEAFDFDRIVTRSIMETLEAVQSIDPQEHSVLVIDSITHLWEAAREAYQGKRMANGGIPIQAWGDIKKPYKQLMSAFLNGNFHAILCGREGVQMEKDEDGEMEVTGSKMKAEGETAYEPHCLFRMKAVRDQKTGGYQITMFGEKDRSGILTGRTIVNPTYETIAPIVRYLSCEKQGTVSAETGEKDAAIVQAQKEQENRQRQEMFETIRSAVQGARSIDSLKTAWALTTGKKGKLGDLFDQLEGIKDARKNELLQAVAA